MAKVSVSEEVIASMLEIMQKARCTLESDVVELRRIYYQAGVDWNDKKYRELGDVIERSCRNILIIGCDLGESKEKLKNLQKNIIEYITSGNASNSNNAAVYARNIESTPWSTISGEHNITVDLQATNPNFAPNTPWSINCQRCVPAYEMRRRGYDVTALPKPSASGTSDLSYHPFAVWENPSVLNTTGNGRNDIENQMAQWGNGARAQITVLWDTGDGGHTFIAEQENGRTRFIDPQTGAENVSWYFDQVEQGETRFCRIDNLNTTNRINECCREV